MTSGVAGIHAAMNRQAARVREQNQATPKPARVRFSVKTAGIGESRLVGQKAIQFGALMLEEPTFSFGVVAVGSVRVGELPLATATVLSWIKTPKGLYTGAAMGFRVESMQYKINLKFSLTFEGTTMRTTDGLGTGTRVAVSDNTYKGTS